jgi:hypothetical protein
MMLSFCSSRLIYAAALTLLAHASLAAQPADGEPLEPSDAAATELRLGGFGTLGAVHTDSGTPWHFLREIQQRGDAAPGRTSFQPDSRLGVQASWRLDPRWEATGQLVLRRRASTAPATESVEWLFATYRPTSRWALRLGRTSPDVFMLADVRNVGFTYPWIRPSVEFYGLMPYASIDGADATYTLQQGDATWHAKTFAGQGRLTFAAGQAFADQRVASRLAGVTVSRESEGLTLKFSVSHAHTHLPDAANVVMLQDQLHGVQTLGLPGVSAEAGVLGRQARLDDFSTSHASLGALVDRGPWLLHAEVARMDSTLDAHDAWLGYASAGYRLGNVTLFAAAHRVRSLHPAYLAPAWSTAAAPLVGPVAAAQLQQLGQAAIRVINMARFDQHTASLGLRWDVAPQLALKTQLDFTHVHADGAVLWKDNDARSGHARLWSVALDFVF